MIIQAYPRKPICHLDQNPMTKKTQMQNQQEKKKCRLQGEDNNLGYEIHKNQQNP